MNGRRGRGSRARGVLALVMVLCALTACAERHAGSAKRISETYYAPNQRRAAPEIRGRTLDGAQFLLTRTRGQVTVINVWASWCDVCRTESRGLGHLAALLAPQGVHFVGIDEHDTDDSGRAFARKSRTTYPQLVDPNGTLLARLTLLPSLGIPSTLVLDRGGRMAARIIGAADEAALADLISRVTTDR